MAMAQEEHTQKYSNSNSGGGGGGNNSRSSKKVKPKKVPQRGLGVAQLEKIRLEEQNRKDAALLAAASALPPNFRPHLSSPSSITLPPPSPTGLASPNSAFRSLQSTCVPKVDAFQSYSNVSFSKPLNVGGMDRSWSAMIVPGNHTWPKLSNGEYNNLKLENQRFDHHGFGFQPNLNLPIESQTPILPLPCVLQRSQQCQRPSSSSMVNVSTGISSSSSALNFQMEPPSNQNYCGNNYTPLWPEEVKMVGVKRPYPFSPEYPPMPAFRCKFPPGYMPSVSKTNESASSSTGCTFNVESSNLPTREGPSNSDSLSDSNPRRLHRENECFGGDFLTLAPPAASALHLDPRYHHSFGNSAPLHLDTSNQGGGEELIQRPGMSRLDQPLTYSFFPSANKQSRLEASPKNSYKGEISGGVDLNLKL